MDVAAAMQAAFDEQRLRDMPDELDGPALVPHDCEVLTCERARFWRRVADERLDEVEHLRDVLRRRGIPIPPMRDGHEADYATTWSAS